MLSSSGQRPSSFRTIRGHWYTALALLLTLFIWFLLSQAMDPRPDLDGSFASHPSGLTTALENQATDLLFQLRDLRHPESRQRGHEEPITIIGIDEGSLQSAGLRAQNWPRSNYARLIHRASEGGASVIGLDLLLMGESGSSDDDKKQDITLVEAIKRAGNIVIAEKMISAGPGIKPAPMFVEAAWAIGFVDLPLDSDGLLRSVAVRLKAEGEDEWQLSFAARLVEGHRFTELYDRKVAELKTHGLNEEQAQTEAMKLAQEEAVLKQAPDGNLRCGDRMLPLRKDGFLQLDFRGRHPAFRYVPASRILNGDADSISDDLFRNRIVLIGQTSQAGSDYYATPFFEPSALARLLDRNLPLAPRRGSRTVMHATAIATMLNGYSLWRPPYGWGIVFVLWPLLLAGFAVFRLRAWLALFAVVFIAFGVLLAGSWGFHSRSLVLPLGSSWLWVAVLLSAGL